MTKAQYITDMGDTSISSLPQGVSGGDPWDYDKIKAGVAVAGGLYSLYKRGREWAHQVRNSGKNHKKRKHGASDTMELANVIETTPHGGGIAKAGSKKIGSQAVRGDAQIFGGNAIQSTASNAIGLRMRLGKHVNANGIQPFLENILGTGTIRTEWSGQLTAEEGERSLFTTSFRHMIRKDGTLNQGFLINDEYDTGMFRNVLWPEGPPLTNFTGTQTMQSSMHIHTSGEDYYAPCNRADYEDMSWNLNKLKIGQLGGDTAIVPSNVPVPVTFLPNEPLYQRNKHRYASAMMQNNVKLFTTAPTSRRPYKYNMHFKHGTINYKFMNKDEGGCVINVIVYKVKETGTPMSGSVSNYTTNREIYVKLTNPLAAGYIKQVAGRLGTESLGGHEPIATDITTNPNYPLLPNSRSVIQANNPWKEVMRNTFVLASGARRNVEIVLPGDIYDPANINKLNIAQADTTTGFYAHNLYPLVDSHGYTVVISVNGIQSSRSVHKSITHQEAAVDNILLDTFCPANLQYYCEYKEYIGAAIYQTLPTNQLYINGNAIETAKVGVDDPLVSIQAVTVLPVDQTVRTANTTTLNVPLGGVPSAFTENNTSGRGGLV